MVWNRRATKKGGRVNGEDAWVWSPEPVHEPIVTMEMYRAANRVAATTERSRQAAGLNRHPQTRRSYRLRSFVFCELCGNRMSGKTIRRNAYFACELPKNLGPKAAITLPDHPPSVYVREDALEDPPAHQEPSQSPAVRIHANTCQGHAKGIGRSVGSLDLPTLPNEKPVVSCSIMPADVTPDPMSGQKT